MKTRLTKIRTNSNRAYTLIDALIEQLDTVDRYDAYRNDQEGYRATRDTLRNIAKLVANSEGEADRGLGDLNR